MGQQDYGAAQPIYDTAKNAYNKVAGFLGGASKSQPTAPKIDDSYHKDMLAKANEAFRKAADEPKTADAPKRVASTGKSSAVGSKPTTGKSAARKRVYTK